MRKTWVGIGWRIGLAWLIASFALLAYASAYLKAHQVTAGDVFGTSVAVSGDTVVVGANGEDSSTTGVNSIPDEGASAAGAAYVFVRSGSTWSQQAYLKAHQVTAYDNFGISVAQRSNASGQRGAKRHPVGRASSLGG